MQHIVAHFLSKEVSNMENVIDLSQISKSFKDKTIIDDIDLSIHEGEIFALLGPSGGGKTTLIKMIIGMLRQDKGTIRIFGKPIKEAAQLQQIGYMAQQDALYEALSGGENLNFFVKLFRLPKDNRQERIAYAADLVQLTDQLDTRVRFYSGGMKRRLSLAIALIQNPQLLILDEPTVGIDPILKKSIWREFERLKREERKTILITTHVMDEAERCDTVAMLHNGTIIANGAPRDLKETYHADHFDDVFLRAGGEDA